MASGFYNQALADILTGSIDMDSNTLKIMLVDASYTYDPDHQVVDNGANDATDPSFNEIVATNYTGGFAGAGRKTATLTVSKQDANNRAVITIGDLTWTALGGATNDTVGGAILIKEITNDTSSRVIAFFDLTDTPTNGGDFTLDFDGTNGNLRFTA
jgi:hypothetical protein